MKIRFKKLHEQALVPTQATDGAANFDFTCIGVEQDGLNRFILHFGLAVEVPEGYKMVIVPRSSITKTHAIQQNSPGQVDSDYRGELQMRITLLPQMANSSIIGLSYGDCPFRVGDRVAQGFIEQVIPVEFEEVKELSETVRGTGGFGHTGK